MKKSLLVALLAIGSFITTAWSATMEDFICFEGTPVVDGKIDTNEYAGNPRVIYKAFREDQLIRVYLNYDDTYIYLGIYVEDDNLYADGPGQTWTTHVDDNVEWYMDPQNNGGTALQFDDTVWAMKINGGGRVDYGNGNGGAASRINQPFSQAVRSAVTVMGTINNPLDKDTGFVMETAIPFTLMQTVKPQDGQVWKMSVIFTEDDDGSGPNDGFTEWVYDHPQVIDEMVTLKGSSMFGPDNWPHCVFSAADDSTEPAPINDVSASSSSPWMAELSFTSPGDNGIFSRAYGYEIRYATFPITTEKAWVEADVYHNAMVPIEPGYKESLRVFGLNPATTYYFSVRGKDEKGNMSKLGVAATITTTAPSETGSAKGKIYVGPMGKRLVYENGTPFNMIGHHLSLSAMPINTCYDGPLGEFGINFFEEKGGYDDAVTYLKALKSEGKNTMRIFLEDLVLAKQGVSAANSGMIEWPSTVDGSGVNPSMVGFIKNILDAAGQAGIYLIIGMYDTHYYPDFFHLTPWYVGNGGPMENRYQIFDAQFYSYHHARLKALVDAARGYDSLLAWEIGNEYDGTWADSVPFEKRIAWLKSMGDYVSKLDPKQTCISSAGLVNLHNDATSFVHTDTTTLEWQNFHNYPISARDPLRNPDQDKSIRPALDINRLLKYHCSRMTRYRTITDSEFGTEDSFITRYNEGFDFAMNVQMTHNILWTEISGGLSGAGLRGQGILFEEWEGKLPDEMTSLYKTISNYYSAEGINWTTFGGNPWDENMRVDGTDHIVYPMGFCDKEKGVGWLLQDTRFTEGSIEGAQLIITGLVKGNTYTIEFWDTYDGTKETPVSQSFLFSGDGAISAIIPAFNRDIAVKWYISDFPTADISTTRKVVAPGQRIVFYGGADGRKDIIYDFYSFIITPDGSYVFFDQLGGLTSAITPKKENATGNIDAQLFLDLTISSLPAGTWHFGAATVSKDLSTIHSFKILPFKIVQ